MNQKPIIECVNLCKSYENGSERVQILKNVNVSFYEGSYTAILGPSGSGKSTLMSILGCLDQHDEGEYLLEGISIRNRSIDELSEIRNQKIGFIFQQFYLLPHLSAVDNVALPLVFRGMGTEERREKALAMLDKVQLSHRAHHKPNQLSGGQKQRVAVARALVTQPKVILADEPTGSLDSETGLALIQLFHELVSTNITIIMVTHDVNLARKTQRIVEVKDGKVIEALDN